MSSLKDLQSSVDSADDLNRKAICDVIGGARAVVARSREGVAIGFLLELLAESVDTQRETAQRLALAHTALMDFFTDQDALSARLQSGNEERG